MKAKHSIIAKLLAGLVLCVPVAANAQGANLEGTWKLAVPQTSLPAEGAKIPFTKDGAASVAENRKSAKKGDFSFDQTMMTCSSPGMPRIMLTPMRFRVFQRESRVTIAFEWNRLFRMIDTRAVAQPPSDVGTMIGTSHGRWEGDTLVVRSVGFLPDKLLDDVVSGSESLELVERLRLKDPQTLENRITITDPQRFTKPWDAVLTYKRQPDEPFPDDNCLDRRAAGKKPLPR